MCRKAKLNVLELYLLSIRIPGVVRCKSTILRSSGYTFRASNSLCVLSFIAAFVALIPFGDKSLYKLRNVPRIFDRSGGGSNPRPSSSPRPISRSSCHDLPYLPWTTIKIVLKVRPRSTSFRRVEIETHRDVLRFAPSAEIGSFTNVAGVCGQETWSATRFAPHLSPRVDPVTPFYPHFMPLHFSSRDIDRSRLTSDLRLETK